MKTWATIATEHLSSLDYTKLAMRDAASTPKSVAGDTALIKWYGDTPSEVAALSHTTMNHQEALELLSSAPWLPQEDL